MIAILVCVLSEGLLGGARVGVVSFAMVESNISTVLGCIYRLKGVLVI